jgi:hypothetical protein
MHERWLWADLTRCCTPNRWVDVKQPLRIATVFVAIDLAGGVEAAALAWDDAIN